MLKYYGRNNYSGIVVLVATGEGTLKTKTSTHPACNTV